MKHWLKKALTGFLCAVTCAAGLFGAVACGDDSSSSPEHTHTYTETVIAQATCTSEGLKKLTCECGDEKQEAIAKLPHVEVDDAEIPATCLSTGLTAGKHCDVCGEPIVAQTPTEKVGHDFTKQDTASKYLASEAECGVNATYYYSCTVCGEKGTETFEKANSALSHVWVSVADAQYIKTQATCTEQAVYYKSCELCHAQGTETFAHGTLAQHNFTKEDTASKYQATAATCTAKATYYYSCLACGEKGTETFAHGSFAQHNFTKQDTTEGYLASEAECGVNATYYYSCVACGEKGTETFEKANSALSHVWVSVADAQYIKTQATCTEQAVYYQSCELCHAQGTETFAHGTLAQHNFTKEDTAEGYLATQAKCGVNATYYYSCVACGEKGTETFEKADSALKHDYQGKLVEPSCMTEGYYVYTCSLCKDTYSDLENMVPATGHTYAEEVTQATCTAQGYTTYTCTCGDTYVGNYTAKAAHSYETTTVASTCQAKGYDEHVCSVCGDTKKDNYQDLAEHTYTTAVTKQPTCQEEGVKTYTYTCACNKTLEEPIAKVAHSHKAGTPVAPTCNEQGYTPYVCEYDGCNDTYQADFVAATGHKEYTSEITTPATCDTAGVRTYTCAAGCGHTYTEVIAAIGHEHEVKEVIAPTCEEQGYTVWECTNDGCEHTYNDTYVAATGHSHQVTNTVEAACETTGYTEYTCACGHSYQEEIPATGHTLSNDESAWILVTDDDGEAVLTHKEGCTYYETYKQACGTCYETVEKTKDVVQHNHTVSITQVATCQWEGIKTFTCSVCSDSYTETYSVNQEEGHQWSTPTTTGGVETVYCLVDGCDAEKTTLKADGTDATVDKNALAQTGEIQMDAATIKMDEATKNQLTGGDGNLDIHASKLGDDDKNDLMNGIQDQALKDKLQDQPIFNFTVANGTISQFDGMMTVTVPYDLNGQDAEGICVYFIGENGQVTEIQAVYTEIDGQGYATFVTDHFSTYTVVRLTPEERCALYGHDWHERTVQATCTTDGYYIRFCVRCAFNETLATYEATGHNYHNVTQNPTCVEKGYDEHICQNANCGYSYRDNYVDALGHSYEDAIFAPTCTERGYTQKTCAVCQHTYQTDYVNANGHSYEETIVGATCDEQGYTLHTCTVENCGHTYKSDYVAAHGHTYVASDVTAPTCGNPGYTKFQCANCDKAYNGEYQAPTGHAYDAGTTYSATCQSEGYTYYQCQNCDSGYKANYQPKTKHQYGEGVEYAPTCQEKGYTRYTCNHCDAYYDDKFVDATAHNYVATQVAPTCTAKGYTLHTCDACGDNYKDAYVNATGHNYGADFLCVDCGAEHPAVSQGQQGFYTALIDSIVRTASYWITIEEMDITETVQDNFNETMSTSFSEMEIFEFSFTFDENNYLVGQGILKVKALSDRIVNGQTQQQLFTEEMKILFTEGKVYVFSVIEGETTYIMTSQEFAEQSMGFPILTLRKIFLQQFSANAASIFATALGINDAEKEQAIGAITEFLFVKAETGNGYTFTLNADQIYSIFEKLTQKSVQELFDGFFGEGAFNGWMDWVIAAVDMTVAEVEMQIEENLLAAGYTLDDLYDLVDETVGMIIGTAGYQFDVRAMLDEIREMTVGALLEEATEMPAEEFKSMLTQIKDMCGQMDVVSLILLMSGEAESPDEAAEYAAALLDEFESIKRYIGDTQIVLSTDKKGAASEITFTLDLCIETSMGGIGANGTPIKYYTNTVEISGKGKITLNGTKDLGLSDVKDLVSQMLVKLDLKDGDKIPNANERVEKTVFRNGDKILLAYGMNDLMFLGEPAVMEMQGEEEIDGVLCQKFTVMWKNGYLPEYGHIQTYGIYTDKEFAMQFDEACGNWRRYTLLGSICDVYYDVWITADGMPIKSEINWERMDIQNETASISFWYNVQTGDYTAENPHDYQLVESQYSDVCGGENIEKYVCSQCGDNYLKEWETQHQYVEETRLLEGALSCEDGWMHVTYCTKCDYEDLEKSYVQTDHQQNWQRGTFETACGEITFEYTSCACGYYCDPKLSFSGNCEFDGYDESGKEDGTMSFRFVCRHCGTVVVTEKVQEMNGCYNTGYVSIKVDGVEVQRETFKVGMHYDVHEEETFENGVRVKKEICGQCGTAVATYKYDSYGRTIYMVNENGFGFRLEMNGCEYRRYDVTPSGETFAGNGVDHTPEARYEYVLADGAQSCLDGVYANVYCACCNEQVDRMPMFNQTRHSFNVHEQVISTPCGSVIIEYGVCACGQEKMIDDVYANGCTLEFGEDEAAMTQSFTCTTCGLHGVAQITMSQNGCTQMQAFTLNVYMGDGDVAIWTLEGYVTSVNHDMQKITTQNPDGSYTVTNGCQNCSYFEEKYTYDQYGRELRFEQANGSGYFYVYQPGCRYDYYSFDKYGEYHQYSDTNHRQEQIAHFATSEQNCEKGVTIEYRCTICGQSDKSYTVYHHEQITQVIYQGNTGCGNATFVKYGCLCGMNESWIENQCKCAFKYEEQWLPGTETLSERCLRTYTCEQCGFVYTCYTYREQVMCNTYYYTVYQFDVQEDGSFASEYSSYRKESNHGEERLEEGANSDGVYMYYRYCAVCNEAFEHWESKNDEFGRQIYYMNRLTGEGWERVYNTGDCSYVEYMLNQAGERTGEETEGYYHAEIWQRYELMDGAETCEQGVWGISYCAACDMENNRWESYNHSTYAHREYFDTDCGKMLFTYWECACGENQGTDVYVEGSCEDQRVWADDESFPDGEDGKYQHEKWHMACAVTACGFHYTYERYYTYESSESCQAVYTVIYNFYDGETLMYEKTLQRKEHRMVSVYVEETYNGVAVHGNRCQYCDYAELWDEYGRWVYYFDPYQGEYGYGYRYTWTGCEYYREDFNRMGVTWTDNGTEHAWETRHIQEACTQYGTEIRYCRVCDARDEYGYVPPKHDYQWNEREQTYICSRCGLKNEKGVDGYFLVEDLTHQYGGYTAGFFNQSGLNWNVDEGYNFYIMFNYKTDENGNVVNGEVAQGVEYDLFEYGNGGERSGLITLDMDSLETAIKNRFGEDKEGFEHVSIVFQVFDQYDPVGGTYSYLDHVLTFGV